MNTNNGRIITSRYVGIVWLYTLKNVCFNKLFFLLLLFPLIWSKHFSVRDFFFPFLLRLILVDHGETLKTEKSSLKYFCIVSICFGANKIKINTLLKQKFTAFIHRYGLTRYEWLYKNIIGTVSSCFINDPWRGSFTRPWRSFWCSRSSGCFRWWSWVVWTHCWCPPLSPCTLTCWEMRSCTTSSAPLRGGAHSYL